MNLTFIDRVIKAYEPDSPEADMARLKFFYGLWEDMDRWSKGPTTADKHYTFLRHLLQLARVRVRRGAAFRRGRASLARGELPHAGRAS